MTRVVIIGQGYVGLPLAAGAASAGNIVTGLDFDTARVAQLNKGISPVDDISNEAVSRMIADGYSATTTPAVIADANVVVICVPTPLGESKTPDLRAVKSAVTDIASYARPGLLVILESTTYPGTTSTLVKPMLEGAGFRVGEDIFLAFSPERIDPGNKTYGLSNTPKVVGADDSLSLKRSIAFYQTFVDTIVPVNGSAEAELTKLLENTYRHVNIALVNELAIFARELKIDIWEVIKAAATKPFGFQAFYPGPGVGGHCIPIDPNYLGHRVKESLQRPFRFVELAEEINSAMPAYMVERIQDALNDARKPLNGARVLLMGVTYKSGIADTRESPASPLAQKLLAKGVDLSFFDPLVSSWQIDQELAMQVESDLDLAVSSADIVVLMQDHASYDIDTLIRNSAIFIDTRGVSPTGSKAIRL